MNMSKKGNGTGRGEKRRWQQGGEKGRKGGE